MMPSAILSLIIAVFYFPNTKVIPLELNYYDPRSKKYLNINDSIFGSKVRLRDIYFSDSGEFRVRYIPVGGKEEIDEKLEKISDAVQMLFDDVLNNVFVLR